MGSIRKYGIKNGDFGNVYRLCYVDNGELPAGYDPITRKQAEREARNEAYRRKYEPMSSGYASAWIAPADLVDVGFGDTELRYMAAYVVGRVLEYDERTYRRLKREAELFRRECDDE